MITVLDASAAMEIVLQRNLQFDTKNVTVHRGAMNLALPLHCKRSPVPHIRSSRPTSL